MEATLTAHEPLLINTVGHSFGVLLFGFSLYFLLSGHPRRSGLSITAAALAFVWNLASLLVLASRAAGWPGSEFLVALSTSAISMLPAVLLHLSLGMRFPWIVRTGYAIGAISVAMHAVENFAPNSFSHSSALMVTTAGFLALTAAAAVSLLVSRSNERAFPSRLVGSMALFLFAMSFVHFRSLEPHALWSIELLVHHAGVPLALIVLLQDYRFLLLDAFLRVLASLVLAAALILAVSQWDVTAPLIHAPADPFRQGLLLTGACLVLMLYALLRSQLQRLLTRILFGRPGIEGATQRLNALGNSSKDEREYLRMAFTEIALFLSAEVSSADLETWKDEIVYPTAASDLPPAARERMEKAGAEVAVPFRLAPGEVRFLLLGRRAGARRYLSEDLQAAERLASQVVEHVERFRAAEMDRLVARAELRALESQIHPHFLFNALNTLYGVIPREAEGARNTVLNLADILRYFLQANKTYIPIEEELRVVEAYLAIEKLRLGPRLRSRIEVDPQARHILIPVLSLQPLVENAVKHAIAVRPDGGEVRVFAKSDGEWLRIRVEDSGGGFADNAASSGSGVGLANVRRRLELCYGAQTELKIESGAGGASVEFLVPRERTVAV